MKNPFSYTSIVEGESFCNRQKEKDELLSFIINSQNILLYSHRRYGKTSLIFEVFKKAKHKRPKINTMHVDLYGTLSEKEFVAAILSSLSQIES
ncbi:MAG TPA: ATPase, partial [Holosporales bacterium]|nr:ATPase [Holosporales bacterium]